jgi:hypothetical protein
VGCRHAAPRVRQGGDHVGWTYSNRTKGLTTRQWFEEEFEWGPGKRREIVADGISGATYYAAVRDNEDLGHGHGHVWAFVAVTRRAAGYWNFGYKDMDETMGPWDAEAPARVLDVLSPTGDDTALEWRARCRAHNACQAFARRVRPGTRLRFLEPVEFADGARLDTFELVDRGRALFRPADSASPPYRIRDWTRRRFELVGTGLVSPAVPRPAWAVAHSAS